MLYIINLVLFNYLLYMTAKSFIFSIIASALLLIFLYAFRVFEPESLESLNEQFVRSCIAVFFAFILIISGDIIISEQTKIAKTTFSIFIIFLTVPFINVLYYKIVSAKKIKSKRYLVIGRKSEISHILDEITRKSKGKYLFTDYINPSPTLLEQKIAVYDSVLIGNYTLYKNVQDIVEKYKGDKNIEFLSELSEKVLKRIPLEVIEAFEEYYELEFEKAKESPAKRVVDIVGSLLGIIVYSPLILISSIAILIEDGFPIVFKQLRIGKDNKEFLLYKIRSMRNHNSGRAKFVGDEKDRILKVGKIIRVTRIDESLQFWNILKGDMSLVGPRPEQVPFAREFEQKIPYYSTRHKLKPGLTGWAQIMYKYSSNLEEVKKKLEYDLYYIKNRTIFLDLRIILQTIEVIFWRRGAS
ncbi:MAG: exopolysaccharide biosynthesis polyprenyl glycosylphosphotransferase [Fervidobacterium sp.]